MKKFTDEEILAIWESVTDFTEGWQGAIVELLSRLDDLKVGWIDIEGRENLEDIRKRLIQLQREIEETTESARNGEINEDDLEYAFRDFGETLTAIEAEVLELELEPDIEEDLEANEDFEEEEY